MNQHSDANNKTSSKLNRNQPKINKIKVENKTLTKIPSIETRELSSTCQRSLVDAVEVLDGDGGRKRDWTVIVEEKRLTIWIK